MRSGNNKILQSGRIHLILISNASLNSNTGPLIRENYRLHTGNNQLVFGAVTTFSETLYKNLKSVVFWKLCSQNRSVIGIFVNVVFGGFH